MEAFQHDVEVPHAQCGEVVGPVHAAELDLDGRMGSAVGVEDLGEERPDATGLEADAQRPWRRPDRAHPGQSVLDGLERRPQLVG